jgi:aspartyl-tRNA(Asn)/glutamyl-tRNA(Gln) amidotransferase subunit B
VRPEGSQVLGTKTEIKNLNSFRFLQKALEFEIDRQIQLLSNEGEVQQETRLWDEENQRTTVMRSKEEAHDYRYFAEPDLLPVVISEEWLEQLENEIPELPEPRRERFIGQYSLSQEEALLLTQTRQSADYFEKAMESCQQPKAVFNWMLGDLTYHLKQDNRDISECPVQPKQIAELVRLIEEGEISGKMAKQVFAKLYETGEDPRSIISKEGLRQISDEDQLQSIIDRVIESNPEKVAAYQGGKIGLLGFFMGQVMKETGGQANPKMINELLQNKLQANP